MFNYDIIIIGAGPAGLSAAIYAARNKRKVLVIEKKKIGGQISDTLEVENYPGILSIEGPEISKIMREQAEKFGAEIVIEDVLEVDLKNKEVKCLEKVYKSQSIIIATGAQPAKLQIQGEKEFTGRGVSYCATCDAPFFQDLEVYVVGGGDTAVEEAIYISKYAKKVYVVHRRDELRTTKSIQEKAFKNDKIDFLWSCELKKIDGEKMVNKISLLNKKENKIYELTPKNGDPTFGIFIMIGHNPDTDLFKNQIDLDERGYIISDEKLKTKIEGVFVAGDCRKKLLRQLITACSDGAIAATQAEHYLEKIQASH